MNLKKMVLGSAGLGVAVIGLIYLLAPHLLLDVYGVDIQSPSEANIFRSGSGALFVAMAVLFCLGAVNTRYSRTSLVTLFTFMSGLAVGRLVSFVADGWPHAVLIAVFVVEASYAGAAAYLLRVEDSSPQLSTAAER
ncbi:DUF4345 domain-containing protein [Streptomyces sp. ME02-8801-2C]|uniref:DUF4345 domain-containing protein n=1 Tax=Streptomyces sp. ME02-8801-2C TaxID=3028680 RepID=UPI0029B4B10B|nr:DUF4345 domain-containing protein [Streptomyces sp. ME02-8801-2C]MDX3452305.1 DUF4345 domain-containing protein [Streptomyces sp. ME02-8801-2C]